MDSDDHRQTPDSIIAKARKALDLPADFTPDIPEDEETEEDKAWKARLGISSRSPI